MFERLTQPERGLLHKLTDGHTLDASSLETLMRTTVDDRFKLARGMLQAARIVATHPDLFVRRSAASRAYYAAYHAARATVFEVQGRDEDDHDKLPRVIETVFEHVPPLGEQLRDLKRLRQEADYSPYPGPPHSGPHSTLEYDEKEFGDLIRLAVDHAEQIVDMLDAYVRNWRADHELPASGNA